MISQKSAQVADRNRAGFVGRNLPETQERVLPPRLLRPIHATPVWVVSTVHRPDDVRILWKQAATLAASGYSVTAVFWTNDASAAGEEEIAGVRRRVFWRGETASGPRRRIQVILRTLHLCLQSGCPNFLLHDPELIPAGIALKRAGRRVIYDAHEDLPVQTLHKPYLAPWQRRLVQGFAKGLAGSANRWLSGQLCATSTIQRRFPKHSCLVRNFPLLSEFSTSIRTRGGSQIVYVGGLSPSRGILELVQAVNELEGSPTLVLAGPWQSEPFRTQCELADSRRRVTYAGTLDRAGISRLLARSDVGVAVLHPAPAYVDALPVKLFEYMAARLPVVVSDFPLWRGIVGSAGCGVLVEPCKVEALRVALAYLLESPEVRRRMGENGRAAVEQRYTWEAESSRFLAFVDRVFGVSKAPEPSEPLALPA